tara:strand:+ start:1797 stop:2414 length:618 start_codon:yes stop_codon:yes gene_type:complete
MEILGLDFDNTLVEYDEVFCRLARNNGLVEQTFKGNKVEVRKHLIEKGMNKEYTKLQAEVYGRGIRQAKAAPNMLSALKKIKKRGIKLIIISHKTERPYAGGKFDLRGEAIEWLKKNEFFEESGLGFSLNQIYFEDTKEKKIERINMSGCTYFIDDMQSILESIDQKINKIWYTHETQECRTINTKKTKDWNEIARMIEKGNRWK